MKKLAFTVLVLLSLSTFAKAQSELNRVAFGFNINQIQNDFGIGLDITSPYFAHSMIAVKLGASLKWLQHLDDSETTWTPYQNVQIGIRSRQSIIENKLFIYSEGGSILIFPNEKFSTESINIGGYGLFGFEFKPSNNFGYYLEIGGVGTGAKADKILTSPIYSNGFLTSAGFRIIL